MARSMVEMTAIKNRIQDELLALPGVVEITIGDVGKNNMIDPFRCPCFIVLVKKNKDIDFADTLISVCCFMKRHRIPDDISIIITSGTGKSLIY